MANDLKSWANELKATQKRCRVCNSTENLEAHHLESKHYSPSLMLSLGNGIVLCDQCHDDFHAFCGGKKASRHDFYKWLQSRTKRKVSLITSSATKNDAKLVKLDKFTQAKINDRLEKCRKKEEIAHAIKCAITYEQQHGELPTKRDLMDLAGCTDHQAKEALKIIREVTE
jgi:hypothetical protein